MQPKKYFNKKTVYNGTIYDSRKEAKRGYELDMLQRAGHICNLERQKRIELLPSFKTRCGKTERAITYVADFFYWDKQLSSWVVEDVKSPITKTLPVYRIKKKMFMYKYPDVLFRES